MEVVESDKFDRIMSVVFDVIGLYKDHRTQIEVFRDGRVVYSPSVNRTPDDIKELLNHLSQVTEITVKNEGYFSNVKNLLSRIFSFY